MADKTPILLALLMNFNALNVVGMFIFLYYSYKRKSEFALRRFPPLTVVQNLCLNVWVNSLLQRSGLHNPTGWFQTPLMDPLTGFYVISIACPIYMTTLALKGFSLCIDYFASKKMYHEATGRQFDMNKHLTPLERHFFWVQQRAFGQTWSSAAKAGLVREESETASIHSTATAGGMARRVHASLMAKVVAFIVVTAGAMIPIGLWCGSCFVADVGFVGCRQPPFYVRMYVPLLVFNGVYALMLPLLLYMLRNIRDVHYIRNETLFNYVILAFALVSQLIVELPDLPFPDPLRGFFFQLCVLPITTFTMIYFPVYLCWRNQRSINKRKIHVQHNPEAFEKILKDKYMMEELKKVLAESYCLENGLFWSDYMEVARIHSVSTTTETERANALRKLYKNYVQPGAPRELNLKGGTAAAIIKAAKANKLALESFKHAKEEVFTMMYNNSFPKLIQQVTRNATTTLGRSRQSDISSSQAQASGMQRELAPNASAI